MNTIKISGTPYEGSPAQCFIDELHAISKSHPLDPKAFILFDCSVLCSPSNGNKDIHIHSMDSHVRGSGSLALKKLCEIADECEVGLNLIAFGYADTPTAKLVEWYTRYGFVSGMGNRTDGYRMRRDPAPSTTPPLIKLMGFKKRPH